MKNQKTIYAIILVVALISIVFVIIEGKKGGITETAKKTQEISQKIESIFKNITSNQLNEMLNDKDFQLINVHTPYIGEIDKTDELIPFDRISMNIDKLPSDKNTKIVVYCQSGGMSFIAAKELSSLGYTNVMNLDGGMIDWQKKGYSIKRK